jgi:hypothetical protein
MALCRPFSAKLPERGGALYRPRETIAMHKPEHEDEFGSRDVEFAMANWDMQRTQSYVERGRQFENATDEDLQTLFVQAFRDWRANLWGDGRRSRVGNRGIEAGRASRGARPRAASQLTRRRRVLALAKTGVEFGRAEDFGHAIALGVRASFHFRWLRDSACGNGTKRKRANDRPFQREGPGLHGAAGRPHSSAPRLSSQD